jgi:hypothetical protein
MSSRAMLLMLGLLASAGGIAGQDPQPPPLLTSQNIATAIGSEADVVSIMRLILPGVGLADGRRNGFFLASQFRAEWLLPGSGLVLLSEREAVTLLEQCGRYWIVERVQRTGDAVRLRLGQRCAATRLSYIVSLDAGVWRLGPPDGGGSWVEGPGSGIVDQPPPECPCLR